MYQPRLRTLRKMEPLPVQRELDLRLPWNGQTPRSLTRAVKLFSFQPGQGPADPESGSFLDRSQIDLFQRNSYGS